MKAAATLVTVVEESGELKTLKGHVEVSHYGGERAYYFRTNDGTCIPIKRTGEDRVRVLYDKSKIRQDTLTTFRQGA